MVGVVPEDQRPQRQPGPQRVRACGQKGTQLILWREARREQLGGRRGEAYVAHRGIGVEVSEQLAEVPASKPPDEGTIVLAHETETCEVYEQSQGPSVRSKPPGARVYRDHAYVDRCGRCAPVRGERTTRSHGGS